MNRVPFIIEDTINTAVMRALQYYALFQYPLKADEIFGNLSAPCSLASVLVALEDLEEVGDIFKYDGYYSTGPDVKSQVFRRKEANKLAIVKQREAVNIGKLIYLFPFVRFIGISGSLSKGYADNTSDFDFFIVTEKNRLWICRTILHVFKKLTFLFGMQHKCCMNYFIDTHDLELQEKNCFTAIELSSLIYVKGEETYAQLKKSNNFWVKTFLPNEYVGFSISAQPQKDRKLFLKKLLESGINIFLPEKVNKMLMWITDKKWRKKWARKNYPQDEYDIAFKTTLHISKNHPANHQKKILESISQIEAKRYIHAIAR